MEMCPLQFHCIHDDLQRPAPEWFIRLFPSRSCSVCVWGMDWTGPAPAVRHFPYHFLDYYM